MIIYDEIITSWIRTLQAPFIPDLESPYDTKYFDESVLE